MEKDKLKKTTTVLPGWWDQKNQRDRQLLHDSCWYGVIIYKSTGTKLFIFTDIDRTVPDNKDNRVIVNLSVVSTTVTVKQ